MSKLKEKWKQKGRRQKALVIIPVSCLLIAAICTGGIFIAFHNGDDNTTSSGVENDLSQLGISSTTDMEDVVSADGSLTYGTTAQNFEITIPGSGRSTASLQIEEVYAESGDTVSEGDEIYKLTDDSVEQVRTLLEKALTDAQSSLKEAQMDYDEESLEAKYTYIENSGMEETELAEYEEKVDEINETVNEALDEYQDALDITESYPDKITELKDQLSTLQESLKSSESSLSTAESAQKTAQSAYDKKYTSYQQALESLKSLASTYKYLLAYTGQDTSVVADIELSKYDSNSDSDIGSIAPETTVSTDTSLNSLISIIKTQYESSLKAFNTAKNDFNSSAKILEQAEKTQKSAKDQNDELTNNVNKIQQEISQYESDLSDATDNLATLKTDYDAAKLQSESDLIDAQNDYDVNVMTYSNAKYNYDKTISELESTLTEAEDAVTDAQDNLDAFEDLAGDGIIKASQDGTLSTVTYEADDYISTGVLVSYVNSDDLSVTVSVSQEDISLVNVGDEAVVYSSDSGMFSGTVKSVASETESESVSNVTYDVTVTVEDGNSMSGGTDVTVYFNMSTDDLNNGGMNKGSQPIE